MQTVLRKNNFWKKHITSFLLEIILEFGCFEVEDPCGIAAGGQWNDGHRHLNRPWNNHLYQDLVFWYKMDGPWMEEKSVKRMVVSDKRRVTLAQPLKALSLLLKSTTLSRKLLGLLFQSLPIILWNNSPASPVQSEMAGWNQLNGKTQ